MVIGDENPQSKKELDPNYAYVYDRVRFGWRKLGVN